MAEPVGGRGAPGRVNECCLLSSSTIFSVSFGAFPCSSFAQENKTSHVFCDSSSETGSGRALTMTSGVLDSGCFLRSLKDTKNTVLSEVTVSMEKMIK